MHPQAQAPQRAGELRIDDLPLPRNGSSAGASSERVTCSGRITDPHSAAPSSCGTSAGIGRDSIRRRPSNPAAPTRTVPAPQKSRRRASSARVKVLGRTDLDQAAAVHDADAIGEFVGLLLIVGDQKRRHLQAPLDSFKAAPQLGADLHVQRAQGLVEQQHGGLIGQCARQGHPLLLAAGDLMGIPVAQAGQVHQIEQFLASFGAFGARARRGS